MTREVVPSGAALGADIKGIDFSKPLNDDDRAFVTQAWNDHLVLRFAIRSWRTKTSFASPRSLAALKSQGPGNIITSMPGTMRNLDRCLTCPESLSFQTSIKTENQSRKTPAPAMMSWSGILIILMSITLRRSILYGIQVPINGGGDTSFVNRYAAYEELSDAMKKRLLAMHIRHDNSRNTAGGTRPPPSAQQNEKRSMAPPIRSCGSIRTLVGMRCTSAGVTRRRQVTLWNFPKTRAKYYSTIFGPMLHRTSSHGPRFGSRGDVIMWDNRCTMHTRNKIDHTQPREMHRSLIKGEPIIPATAP